MNFNKSCEWKRIAEQDGYSFWSFARYFRIKRIDKSREKSYSSIKHTGYALRWRGKVRKLYWNCDIKGKEFFIKHKEFFIKHVIPDFKERTRLKNLKQWEKL